MEQRRRGLRGFYILPTSKAKFVTIFITFVLVYTLQWKVYICVYMYVKAVELSLISDYALVFEPSDLDICLSATAFTTSETIRLWKLSAMKCRKFGGKVVWMRKPQLQFSLSDCFISFATYFGHDCIFRCVLSNANKLPNLYDVSACLQILSQKKHSCSSNI